MKPKLTSSPRPAKDYQTAVSRFNALRSRYSAEPLNPTCYDRLLTHGERVETAVVLFHGLTNCPRQFSQLGDLLHEQGYNVLIPRVPYHGHANTLTTALQALTASQLANLADEAIDIAQGLGEHVVVMGLSMGGVLTGWVTQFRADVTATILLSPAFGVAVFPVERTRPLTNLSRILPNRFMWWDPENEASGPGPDHAYPRFATRALAEVMHLGFFMQDKAKSTPPAVRNITIVHNPNDEAISHPMVEQVRTLWSRPEVQLRTYEMDAALGVTHDFIEPEDSTQNIAAVYPILLELVNQAAPKTDTVPAA
ncbi:MAG: alpha/beta fold hydrolase [Chloroflexota bacterium]